MSAAGPSAKPLLGRTIFLLSLMRRKENYWNVPRLLRGLLRAHSFFVNWQAQIQILDLLERPAFQGMTRRYPMFSVKYMRRNYLCRDLATELRAAALIHHYQFMHQRLEYGLLRRILFEKVTLWQSGAGPNVCAITLALSDPVDNEGEFSLHFDLNGTPLFILSFSAVPGRVVETAAQHALLIARLQGIPGQFNQFRLARKLLSDVAPPAALMAALEGIAKSLAIRDVAGLCSTHNNSYGPPFGPNLEERYEGFFIALGMTRSSSGTFCLARLPLPEKPLQAIKPGHRLRTKAKRALKDQIRVAAAEAVRCDRMLTQS
jgi:uncharacterized protein VirK/YbjX